MPFEAIFTLVIVAIIALYVWFWIVGKKAEQTFETTIPVDRVSAIRLVEDKFGKIRWKDVDGPGGMNKKRRNLAGNGAVISINFEESGAGSTTVSAWVSFTEARLGVNASQGLNKSRTVIRDLAKNSD